MSKKVVRYTSAAYIKVGASALVTSGDHPDIGIVGELYGLHTSRVISYDETTGIFETLNTVYVPMGPEGVDA